MRNAMLLLCASLAHAAIPLGYTGGGVSTQGGGPSISVTDPNHNGGDFSVCTGPSHDDRTAFQTTLNSASTNHIPTVTMPATTCYMNSFVDLTDVLGNLQLPNGVTLQGTVGLSKIMQTPAGRPACPYYCNVTVINIGIFRVTWSKMGCPAFTSRPCIGYYPLHTPTVGSNVVTLLNSSQGSLFHIGDYITIYDHEPQSGDDVINGFQSTITNVSGATITVADNLARSWSAPYIGNLSTGVSQGLANIGHDIGLKGVIVQGACALMMTETFNLTLADDQFITDTDLFDSNHQYIAAPQWNSLVHFTFDNNQFITIGSRGSGWAAEFPQRNTGFGLMTNNTFGVAGPAGFNSWGGSEYAHNLTFTANHVYTNPFGSRQGCGFNWGVQNATFSNNDFHTSGGWSVVGGGLLCDISAPADTYGSYGNMTYSGNNIICEASPETPCVVLQAIQGLKFNGNTITVPAGSSSLYGLLLQYYPADTQINNNQIHVQGGYGIYAQPASDSGWTINSNIVTAVAGQTGITVLPAPNPVPNGTCSVQNNTSSSGFATRINGDPNGRNCTVGNNN